MSETLQVREFDKIDEGGVVALWNEVLPSSQSWNDPKTLIQRKLRENDGLFFVGELDEKIVATVIGGYDGVRGWIYSLAVSPDCRNRGFGRLMVEAVERSLQLRGCPKINLQVRGDNSGVVTFYEKLGFEVESRISMGKRGRSISDAEAAEPVPEILVGDGIRLANARWSDKESFIKYFNESEDFYHNMVSIPQPYTAADAENWLTLVTGQTLARDKMRSWAIRNEADELIGSCGFSQITEGGKAELGYWLAKPYWGRGIMTNVVRSLCRFGFDEFQFERIYARVLAQNTASARVLEKAGFTLEAKLPKHVYRDGEGIEVRFYGLLRDD